MLSDQLYVCSSAANAILSQVGQPLRMSTDALQCVNQFLDEFLVILLLQLNNTIETARIKHACFQLLPNMLGKNALVEADLQIKHSDAYHFEHVDIILPLLRSRCVQQSTLSSSSSSLSSSSKDKQDDTIPNWVIVYITAMIEHIGEHTLTSVANSIEKAGHISVKDVYHALKQDAQLALLFSRMDLHDKIQKRVGTSFINNRPRSCYLPQSRERYTAPKRNSVVEISFEDLDIDYNQDERIEPIKYSTKKFKPPPRVQSVYAPDFPKTNFEDLIKSNSTVKVSLTPNRLKSIEDNTVEEKAESFIARSRRSTLASLKRIASTVKRPTSVPVVKKVVLEEEPKRPTSTPPVHIKSKNRSSSVLSSPRTSHMSIPSLSETSRSHYSTSSLASTLSNTSLGLSTIGEERKHVDQVVPYQESITQILNQQEIVQPERSSSLTARVQQEPERSSSLSAAARVQQEPERPSSIVARRAHRLGNIRPKSYHESQATQRYAEMLPPGHSVRHSVMDKVLQFERVAPRKKRGIDQAVQTDTVKTEESDEEEWFIEDDELEAQDEADIVNWLLGE